MRLWSSPPTVEVCNALPLLNLVFNVLVKNNDKYPYSGHYSHLLPYGTKGKETEETNEKEHRKKKVKGR